MWVCVCVCVRYLSVFHIEFANCTKIFLSIEQNVESNPNKWCMRSFENIPFPQYREFQAWWKCLCIREVFRICLRWSGHTEWRKEEKDLWIRCFQTVTLKQVNFTSVTNFLLTKRKVMADFPTAAPPITLLQTKKNLVNQSATKRFSFAKETWNEFNFDNFFLKYEEKKGNNFWEIPTSKRSD